MSEYKIIHSSLNVPIVQYNDMYDRYNGCPEFYGKGSWRKRKKELRRSYRQKGVKVIFTGLSIGELDRLYGMAAKLIDLDFIKRWNLSKIPTS
jgi:hypothetical protein